MNAANNLFLIGMPGAGKTTVGRAIAKHLGKPFFDSDHEIEARTGVKVITIFEIEGEAGFRRREAEAIDRLTLLDKVVLATGGGAILDSENRSHLKDRGFVVYLHAAPKELWRRMRHDRSRPLLQGADPRTRLEELYRARDPLYRETAHMVIDTGRQSANALISDLLPKLEKTCGLSA